MTQARRWLILLPVLVLSLLPLVAACGRYGPPVRASAAEPTKPPPRVEVPLPEAPAAPPSLPGAPAAPPAAPEVEEEPPPEGAP